jgi:4'-phosphopantetheinyl transferase
MTLDSLSRRLPSSVFLRAVTYDEDRAAGWRTWLSEEEAACLASFGARKRRREFVAGRAAARALLADRLDTSPERVPLRRADDDAVDVLETGWSVSISHSGPHALAACARHRIGVDLEHIRPRDPAIARFLFAPDDRGLVDALPYDADAALILCWTLKEAVLKARRTGFRTSPKDLHLSVTAEQGAAVVEVEGRSRWVVPFSRVQGYWSAVAYPEAVALGEQGG